jgi:pyruvate,water dikinase
MIDVIDLKADRLRTIELSRLLEDFGDDYPHLEQIVSLYEYGQFLALGEETVDFDKQKAVATFDGLTTRSPFALHIRNLLRALEESLETPVEIEFASDGEHFYLLQCRPQNFAQDPRPAIIPKEIPQDRAIFSADRLVSNGRVSNITHIIYVDPAACEALEEPLHRRAVGQAVGELNKLLPKRQFILMGPAHRRGLDLKLGDVDKAAALVGLIKPQDGDEDALSFGLQFLQDLVESGIRYLPVLTDDGGANLNRRFLTQSRNVMPQLLPNYAFLSDVVRVIDVSKATDGKVLQLLMNADLGKAVGFLADSEEEPAYVEEESREEGDPEYYWRWRYRMAEQVAARLEPGRFGAVGFYLFGSTKNGTAGPASDIDVLIHLRGTDAQREELELWLEGWSLCLDEANYLQTGYRSRGLLDVHIVTDEDIQKRTSFAVKIDAVTDAARPLKMMETEEAGQTDSTTNSASERKGAD